MDYVNLRMIPENIDNEPNMAYLQDLYLKKGKISDRCLFNLFEDQYTEFEKFEDNVNLDIEETEKILEEHTNEKKNMFHMICKAKKNNLFDFFYHTKQFKNILMIERMNYKFFSNQSKEFILSIKEEFEEGTHFENIPGRNPSTWPLNLVDFIENLQKLTFFAFFQQPFKLHKSFYEILDKKYLSFEKKIKKSLIDEKGFETLRKIFSADLLMALLKGSFHKFISFIEKLINISKILPEKEKAKFNISIKKSVCSIIKEIIFDVDKAIYDFKPLTHQINSMFSFVDMKIFEFHVGEYTFTTDGDYIYEAIYNSGCLLLKKIGTGNNDTKAGVVYKEQNYLNQIRTNISMIYLKNRLYINDSSRLGGIEVYDLELQKIKGFTLDLNDYFENPHLLRYNKNFQIFSDGEYLYTVLMKVRTVNLKVDDPIPEVKKPEVNVEKTDEKKKEDIIKVEELPIKKMSQAKKILDPNELIDDLTLIKNPGLIFKSPEDTKIRKLPEIVTDAKDLNFFPDKINDILDISELGYFDRRPRKIFENQGDNFQFSQKREFNKLKDDLEKRIKELDKEIKIVPGMKDFMGEEEWELLNSANKDMKDKFMNFRSLNIIKNIFKSSINKPENEENGGMEEAEFNTGDYECEPNINPEVIDLNENELNHSLKSRGLNNDEFNFLFDSNGSKISRGMFRSRGRGRGRNNEKLRTNYYEDKNYIERNLRRTNNDITVEKIIPKNEVEKNIIEFYVVKFDLDEKNNDYTEEEKQKFREHPIIQELYESFEGIYSYEKCGHSYYKCFEDMQEAAEFLIEKGSFDYHMIDFKPLSEVLIYQTTTSTYDFNPSKPVKNFNVVNKSLLNPQDVTSAIWFLKDQFLLKSTGQLFSIDPSDEIFILPDHLNCGDEELFSKRRNSKLQDILNNFNPNLSPEYLDSLYEEIVRNVDEKSFNEILRKNSKTPMNENGKNDKTDVEDKNFDYIRTTFIKTYQDKIFIQNSLKTLCYDFVNDRFCVMNFFKMTKTSNNFIKQDVVYYNDNFNEINYLRKLVKMDLNRVQNPFLYFVEILKAANLNELILKLMDFLVYLNANKIFTQKRTNDWVFILSQESEKLNIDKKKKKSTLNAQIKKLKLIKSKKDKPSHSMVISKKNPFVRELYFVHHLCLKGNFKTLLKMIDLYKNSNIDVQIQIFNLLEIFSIYLDLTHSKDLFELLKDILFKGLEQNDDFLKEILIKIIFIFTIDKKFFISVIQFCLKNNKEMLIRLMSSLINKMDNLKNMSLYNERLILKTNANFDLNISVDPVVNFSMDYKIKKSLFKVFKNQNQLLQDIFDQFTDFENKEKFLILKFTRKMMELKMFFKIKTKTTNPEKDKKGLQKTSEKLKSYFKPKEEENKISNQVLKSQEEIVEENFFFFFQNISKILKEIKFEECSKELLEELVCFVNYISFFIFNSKIKLFKLFEDILSNLLLIINKMKNYLVDSKVKLQLKTISNLEGISQLESYIAETPHPIERGKKMKFKTVYKPKALGFHVEFDSRCQDEEQSDSLVIKSWYNDQPKGGNSYQNDAIFSKNVTINFRNKKNGNLIMLGDSINVNFAASLVAKQNIKSLNQWGYKLTIRPIYARTLNEEIFSDCDVNNKFLLQTICKSLESLCISSRILLDFFVIGNEKNKNSEISALLDWNILQNGITSLKYENYLLKIDNKYKIIKEDVFKNTTLHKFYDELDNMSKVSKKTFDKLSLGKEFEKEIEFESLLKLLNNKESHIYNLIQHIKSLTMEHTMLIAERRRPFFFKNIQQFWNEVENMIILCYIKHTNLLKLIKSNQEDINFVIDQKNIKEQLINISKNKNKIIGYMLKEVQIEKDYQYLIQAIFEVIKENCMEKYIKTRIKKQIEDQEKKLKINKNFKEDKKTMIKKLMRKNKNQKKKSKNNTPSISHNNSVNKIVVEDDTKFYYITKEELNETIKDEKIIEQMLKIISDKYEGIYEKIEELFKRKKIDMIKEKKVNFIYLLNNCIQVIKDNMEPIKNTENYNLEVKMKIPYEIVALNIKKKCELLLQLESEMNEEEKRDLELTKISNLKPLNLERVISHQNEKNKEEEKQKEKINLKPLGISRSLTSDSRKNNNNKQLNLWIENYKNWKDFMTKKKENVESSDCSPIFAVSEFLCLILPVEIEELQNVFVRSSKNAAMRVVGFQYYKEFLKLSNDNWLNKYFGNLTSAIFCDLNIFQNIKIIHSDFKNVISDLAIDISGVFIQKTIQFFRNIKELKPQDFQEFKKSSKKWNYDEFSCKLEEFTYFFKNIIYNQIEILSLINNKNFAKCVEEYFEDPSKSEYIQNLKSYLSLSIEFLLFTKILKNLSFDFRELKAIVQKAFSVSEIIIFKLFKYLKKRAFIEKIFFSILQKELGHQKEENYYRLLSRSIHDVFGVKRIVYILKLFNYYFENKINDKKNNNGSKFYENFLSIFFIILKEAKNNHLIKNSIRSIMNLKNNYNLEEFFLGKYQDNKEIIDFELTRDDIKILKNSKTDKTEKIKLLEEKKKVIKSYKLNTLNINRIEQIMLNMGSLLSLEKNTKKNEEYKILIHLVSEEQIIPLIRILYLWEILNPTFSKDLPKNLKEYLEYKKKKDELEKEEENKKTISNKAQKNLSNEEVLYEEQMSNLMRFKESVLENIPDIDMFSDIDKNMGWYFNLFNCFKNFKSTENLPKEILVKITNKVFDMKNLNQFSILVQDSLKNIKLPGEEERQQEKIKLKMEINTELFNDEYGYCLDLLFENWENLEEKIKSFKNKITLKKKVSIETTKVDNVKKKMNEAKEHIKNLKSPDLKRSFTEKLKKMEKLQLMKLESEKYVLEAKVQLLEKEKEEIKIAEASNNQLLELINEAEEKNQLKENEFVKNKEENKPDDEVKEIIKEEIKEAEIKLDDNLKEVVEVNINNKELKEEVQNNEVDKQAEIIKENEPKDDKEDTIKQEEKENDDEKKNLPKFSSERKKSIRTKALIKKSQEEEFIQTFQMLQILSEVIKSVRLMGSLLNFTGFSEVILPKAYFSGSYEKMRNFCALFDLLNKNKLTKLDIENLKNDKIKKKLLPFITSVNKDVTNKFEYSIVKSYIINKMNRNWNFSRKIKVPVEDYVKYTNKNNLLVNDNYLAQAKSSKIRILSKFVENICLEFPSVKNFMKNKYDEILKNNSNFDKAYKEKINLGFLVMNINWENNYCLDEEIVVMTRNENLSIIATERNLGKNKTIGVYKNNSHGILMLKKNNIKIKSKNLFLDYFEKNVKVLYENLIELYKEINNKLSDAKDNTNDLYFKKLKFIIYLHILQKVLDKKYIPLEKEFKHLISQNMEEIYVDYEEIKKDFIYKTENLLDNLMSSSIRIPLKIKLTENLKALVNQKNDPEATIEPKKISIKEQEKVFTLNKSSHLSDMLMSHPKVLEFKMLKYWEKNIIPKIHNFVKGSLSVYEIDDFFEQMRIQLRKSNYSESTNIAYILCDQKLPNNCYLPGLNYDWNSLNLDEIIIGQWIIIKIKDERNLYSPFFEEFEKLNINTILGLVIQKDFIKESINVLVWDLALTFCYSVWVPQQAVRPISTTLPPPAQSYSYDYHVNKFEKTFDKLHKVLIRNLIVKDIYRETDVINIKKEYMNIRIAIQYELKGHCLDQWLEVNGNFVDLNLKNEKLNFLVEKITQPKNIDLFLDKLKMESQELVEFFKENLFECDMQKAINIQSKKKNLLNQNINLTNRISSLCIFPKKHKINGIAIEFEENSNLFNCSGLKFFSDKEGINLITHLQATQKSSYLDLEPLIFNNNEVYYQFYYNEEALPVYMKNQTTTSLKTIIYAIPYQWNYVLWCIDSLTSFASINNNSVLFLSVFEIFLVIFNNFQGPNVARKFLFQLFTRLLIKFRELCKKEKIKKEDLKVLEHFNIQNIINSFELLLNKEKDEELVSNLTQEIAGFLAIYYSLKKYIGLEEASLNNINQNIKEISVLFDLAEFISNPSQNANSKVLNLLKDSLSTKQYQSQFILIEKIPNLNIEPLTKIIKETLQKSNIKILIPELDIYIPCDSQNNSVGYAIILHDGLKALSLDDLKEVEDELEEEEIIEEARLWQCGICTLLNADTNTLCDVCTSPKPPNPIYPADLEKEKEEKKKKEIKEESQFSKRKRLLQFKNLFDKALERLTPDKRVTVKIFNKIDQNFLESNEYLEFIFFRITSEIFQEKMKKVAEVLFSENKDFLIESFQVNNDEDFYNYLMEIEPNMLFDKLSEFGIDPWLERTGCGDQINNQVKLIPKKEIGVFQNFLLEDCFNNIDEMLNYDPFNFRIEFKNNLKNVKLYDEDLLKKLDYNESKNYYYKMMKYNHYDNFTIKCTLNAIVMINEILIENFKFINMMFKMEQSESLLCLNLGTIISNIREYLCSNFINTICEKILENTALIRDSTPKVIVERITKEKEIMVQRKTQKNIERSYYMDKNYIFLQAYKQMKDMSPTMFRSKRPRGTEPFIAFEIIFKGEHVMGEAGPYRQFFTDISGELQNQNKNSKLDLLIPSPNKEAELGDYKDKFTINPSCKSSYHLQLYEFLGELMGCAFRTGTFLSLDLPSLFWKKLVHQNILEKDIEELDKAVMELVRFIKESSGDIFDNVIFENFTTFLSDKKKVELIPGGENIKVDVYNRKDFINKLIKTRLAEADIQIQAIRKGIIKIVPEVLLNCLNASTLEKKICGRKKIDFDILKRSARYSGGLSEESQLIKNFWEVLFDLSDKDKLLFVKFCWGQERLPTNMKASENVTYRFMVKPAQYEGNQDGILPRADTCFFNFELPNYSTKDIMKERILLAIHTDCDSMNAEEIKSDNEIIYEEVSERSYSDDF